MKKILIIIFIAIILSTGKYYFFDKKSLLKIDKLIVESDIDADGINDIDDILQGARKEVKNKTNYKSAYYGGGYPPENEGVCSDLFRRSMNNAGINIKDLIDEDIKKNLSKYPRTNGKPDPNIDFRRVPNIKSYLDRNANSLEKEVIPGNIDNLKKWQAGDIVIFGKPKEHIAIISDKRNENGIPYIIHNSAPVPKENDMLLYWNENISPIIGHYRWNY